MESDSPNKRSESGLNGSDLMLDHCDHCTKVLDGHGNYYHGPGCSVLLNKTKRLQIQLLSANVQSKEQLRKIIMDVQPKMRREVYNLIAPNCTRFIVPSFESIVRPRGPRTKKEQ
jgi:hypothetical protein